MALKQAGFSVVQPVFSDVKQLSMVERMKTFNKNLATRMYSVVIDLFRGFGGSEIRCFVVKIPTRPDFYWLTNEMELVTFGVPYGNNDD